MWKPLLRTPEAHLGLRPCYAAHPPMPPNAVKMHRLVLLSVRRFGTGTEYYVINNSFTCQFSH